MRTNVGILIIFSVYKAWQSVKKHYFCIKTEDCRMYEKKTTLNIDCCIKVTMEVIGGKWKCCIIDALKDGAKRPSEIHRYFPKANTRVINQQLKELEMHGIVEKRIFDEQPPHSEYSLTETGKTLLPIIKQLEEWGIWFRPTLKKIYGMAEDK